VDDTLQTAMPFISGVLLLVALGFTWRMIIGSMKILEQKKQRKQKGRKKTRRMMAVVSGVRRRVGSSVRRIVSMTEQIPNSTKIGEYGRNELDTHADTCCAGSNWRLMEYTGETCQVSPFLESYDATNDVPIAKCGTVWTSDVTGQEYLLVGDQMLWFGDRLGHSLLNPNQMRMFGLSVCDDPWDEYRTLGVDCEDAFIPFEMDGTNVFFETRVPTDWELLNLPVIPITGDTWDPSTVVMKGAKSREEAEMRTIRSLTSGRTRRQIAELQVMQRALCIDPEPESDRVLRQISSICCDERELCRRLIGAVNIATTYRKDIDEEQEQWRSESAVLTKDRHSQVTPEELAKKWNIGLDTAKKTLQVTTQAGIRQALHPLHRRYRVDHLMLNRKRLNGHWYTDTLLSKVKSLNGNTGAQVYTNGKFSKVFPIPSRSMIGKTLTDMSDDVGIPDVLTTDGASEMTGRHTEFVREANRLKVKLLTTEQGRKNQNYAAEREIGELKKRWKHRMNKKRVPKRLWDYGLVYEAEILSRVSRGKDGRTGYEEITGQTADISEWLDFEFYDLVWWFDRHVKPDMTDGTMRLARCISSCRQ